MYVDYENYIKKEEVRQWIEENVDEGESADIAIAAAADKFFAAAKKYRGGVEGRISDIAYYDVEDWIDDGLPEFFEKKLKLHCVYDGEDRYYFTLAAATAAARETLASDILRNLADGEKKSDVYDWYNRDLPTVDSDAVTIADLDAIRDTYSADDARVLADFLRFARRISCQKK